MLEMLAKEALGEDEVSGIADLTSSCEILSVWNRLG